MVAENVTALADTLQRKRSLRDNGPRAHPVVVWAIFVVGPSVIRSVGGMLMPLVRVAIRHLLPAEHFGAGRYVDGYWTRRRDIEVGFVGAKRETMPVRVDFVDSIKLMERNLLYGRDVLDLTSHRRHVPGADDATLVDGVSRTGLDAGSLDVELGTKDLIRAWS